MPAASAATITLLREKIRDEEVPGPATYEDTVYENAVGRSLEKLSYDFSTAYTSDSDVPHERTHLMLTLATIELCYIRAGDGISSSASAGDIETIAIPDLSITNSTSSTTGTGTDFWLKLASLLQDEYDTAVGADGGGGSSASSVDTLPEVGQGVTFRTALRTGSRTSYGLDSALTAPATFTATATGSTIIVTWSAVRDKHFAYYEIYRAATSADLEYPDSTTSVKIVPDPNGLWSNGHVYPRWSDTNDGSGHTGTLYYRLAIVNSNSLRSFTPVASATIL
jgi:hypothetical protein